MIIKSEPQLNLIRKALECFNADLQLFDMSVKEIQKEAVLKEEMLEQINLELSAIEAEKEVTEC